MSKKRKLEAVEISRWPSDAIASVDWALCVFCQERTTDGLVTPTQTGYQSLVDNLVEFAEYDALPRTLRLRDLDDGSGLLDTLVSRNAKYHKLCRCKYDSQKLARLIQRKDAASSVTSESECSRSTRSKHESVDIKNVCLFCNAVAGETKEKLINASTLTLGPKILAHATELQDSQLLAKLSSSDFVAMEAKYHKLCYVTFLTRVRSSERANDRFLNNPERLTYGLVVSELVQYIQDMYMYSNTSPVFKLSELTRLVTERMEHLGVEASDNTVNRTRLKEQLLALVPGLREDKSGREVLISFEPDLGSAVRDACANNDVSDGMCLARAASILRRDLFKQYPKFSGSFDTSFNERDSVPLSLLNFISMVLEGSKIDNVSESCTSLQRTCMTISQLIRFNSVKRARSDRQENIRHHPDRECPMPLYLGLMVHACTRKKSLVNKLNALGLSISYDRVQEISATLTNTICDHYNSEDDVVCPTNLIPDVFTTAAIDNIDHNPTSNTAVESFHGSSVTIIQHPERVDIVPSKSLDLGCAKWTRKVTSHLPLSYTSLRPTLNPTSEWPLSTVNTLSSSLEFNCTTVLEPWLDSVRCTVNEIDSSNKVSFAAYHSDFDFVEVQKCHSTLLPLLKDEVQTPAMVDICLMLSEAFVPRLMTNSHQL